MTAISAAGLIALAALAAFGLSLAQASINARHGTDHAVHTFLINRIRENRFRLFVRIPRLVNEAYVGALPLYLHAIMARLPLAALPVAEKVLNPSANLLLVLLTGWLAWEWSAMSAPLAAAACYALTPQFYHALSARNFGLSARSLGLIFLTLAFAAAFATGQYPDQWWWWLALGVSCYLVIAFSTFAAQALVLVGTLTAIISSQVAILGGLCGGLLLFIGLHPTYGTGYLANTIRFIRAYASELAPVYVLARRPSLWRDLVWDIWRRFGSGLSAGFRYAYENSLLIVAFLNPFALVAALGLIWVGDAPLTSFERYACEVAIAGLLATFLTSFRATRFLGEPERYVEATSVFAAIGGTAVLFANDLDWLAWLFLAAFVVMNVLQLQASRMLSRYLSAKPLDLSGAVSVIGAADAPLVAGNNEQLIKLLLVNDWRFAYCIAVGRGYCGMRIDEAFDPFPFVRREALARIVATYRINTCVLDRAVYETVFDHPPIGLQAERTVFESEGLRVVRLEWADPVSAST